MGLHFKPMVRYILCLRFRLFTLQKLAIPSWYLRLYSLKASQALYKCYFYPISHESLWIQLGSILLPVLYAGCIMSPISFHTKTKKRQAPSFHKPILRELHWTLSILISTFAFVWANECGSMVCCWLFTRKSNRSKCLNSNFSKIDTQERCSL